MGANLISFIVGLLSSHIVPSGRGEDAEPRLRASNEGLLRPRVARATEVGVLAPPSSPLGFGRRPIHFGVAATVEA